MFRRCVALAILALSGWASRAPGSGADSFEVVVAPFFQTYCIRCHGAKQQKGEFRLDTLPRDFASQEVAERWGEMRFRLNAGEMPPKKEPQPKAEELAKVVDWISVRMQEGEAARLAKRGPVAHYRLSRDEYANTVKDLLGVHYDVTLPGAFNEDPRWHGFERIGSLLSLSPSHVDRYIKAAETVLDRAFPQKAVKAIHSRKTGNDDREAWLSQRGLKGPARWVLWPNRRMGAMTIKEAGTYRIRIKLSGLQPPGGRVPHLTLWNNQTKSSIYDEDILTPEDQPIVLELEVSLSPGGYGMWNSLPPCFNETSGTFNNTVKGGVFTHSREVKHLNPTGYMLFADDGRPIYPVLLVDFVEVEGPLAKEADLRKREGILPKSLAKGQAKTSINLEDAQSCLQRFASRAWRRPATEAEINRYLKILEHELKAGEKPASAYRAALIGILASKNFLYLEEGSAESPRDRVNDWELASRLSYFLWGSMPDDALFAVAAEGKLRDPKVLRTQFARMVADGKIDRFTDAFPRQWLQLHRVGMFAPDQKLYPDYDEWLERSMVLETTKFFETVFTENLSLREFLTSDWTILNARLAMHYDLPTPPLSGFQKVKLRPEDHRGGLLTQAAVLSLTSDGTRHRPVHRGVWVSEAIFGRTPPPPPPNVEPLEPTPSNQPKATIRQQLEAHATHAVCASCHQKIDPLGFAFDNYDAIGQWRTEERVEGGKGSNPRVNAAGTLPDGRRFSGPVEFKTLLAADLDRFAEAFVEQLATFALRRVMTIDDTPQIKAIAAASKADGYRLRNVIENLVMSDLFQKR